MFRHLRNALVAAAFVALAACGEHGHTRTVYVFIDVTDSAFRSPAAYSADFPKVLAKLRADTNGWGIDGGEVRLLLLNDLSQSNSASRVLRAGTSGAMGENRLSRRDSIRVFARGVWHDLDSLLKSTSWERSQSKIYQNLCRGLTDLAEDHSEEKTMIVYSDMLENSKLLSFYGPLESVRARADSEQVVRRLEAECIIPAISSVDVNIVTFRRAEMDDRVNVALAFWKRLLEKKGAVVHVGAQLR